MRAREGDCLLSSFSTGRSVYKHTFSSKRSSDHCQKLVMNHNQMLQSKITPDAG